MMNLVKELAGQLSLRGAGSIGLDQLDDGATIKLGNRTLVFTTDGHAVKPIFFPGGDIGRLAVSGTVNDLAVMGAEPLALSCAVLVEEGFQVDELLHIYRSMNSTSRGVGVPIITGDLKTMERGSLDGVVITTAGVGMASPVISDAGAKPGDKVLITGSVGDHGITILASREGMDLGGDLRSDVAPIWKTVKAALKVGGITAMKDPTRGGVAGALNEIASKSGVGISMCESGVPIRPPTRAAGEMLGIDPLQITNEGKAILTVRSHKCDEVLKAIRRTKYGKKAAIIGEVTKEHSGQVILETAVGGHRLVDVPIGDPAPRIC
jgi:hydrogenase expression/formation protein HypE